MRNGDLNSQVIWILQWVSIPGNNTNTSIRQLVQHLFYKCLKHLSTYIKYNRRFKKTSYTHSPRFSFLEAKLEVSAVPPEFPLLTA